MSGEERRFMVVADGAGECDLDFSVVWVEAVDAVSAAQIAVSPEQGYGRRDGGKVYVVPADDVWEFATAQRTVVDLIGPEGDVA